MRFLIQILLLGFLMSCDPLESDTNPYFKEVYPQILEDIDISCSDPDAKYYISALINGKEFCHSEELVGEFKFAVSNKFTTSSPQITIGEVPSNTRHGLSLRLGNAAKQFNEYFVIHFPDFELDDDVHLYLDSIIAKREHGVIGKEDIVLTEGIGILEKGHLESSGGYLNNFLIEFRSTDLTSETGGNSFKISSIFGNQESSYFRFNEVRRTTRLDGIYYYLDILFECNLYHWPQYGYEGLWGEVRDGRIIVELRLRE